MEENIGNANEDQAGISKEGPEMPGVFAKIGALPPGALSQRTAWLGY